MKKCEKGKKRGSETFSREKSHSNEIESIWKLYFVGFLWVFLFCFCTQMHIEWPHLVMDHQSRHRTSVRGREENPHKRRQRQHPSSYYCYSQLSESSLPESLSCLPGLLSGSVCGRRRTCNENSFFLICIFLLTREMTLRSEQLSISYSLTTYSYIFLWINMRREISRRATFSLLTDVDAQVQNTPVLFLIPQRHKSREIYQIEMMVLIQTTHGL